MSLFNYLMEKRDKAELAKELSKTALENAQLRNRVHEVETELFWLRVDLKNKEK